MASPDQTADGVLAVASLLDLFGTKLKVLLQRVAARDYVDWIWRRSCVRECRCRTGWAPPTALYGNEFPPIDAVKALTTSASGGAHCGWASNTSVRLCASSRASNQA
ncbi:MAG: hypothetical protein OXP28_13080, partial [Gammaproteobacteria bacterium]|nr:hypothetical protein [Gammaproteobacteria bacterium]